MYYATFWSVKRLLIADMCRTPTSFIARGSVTNLNTIEVFRELDKTQLIKDEGIRVSLLSAWFERRAILLTCV